MSVHCQCHCSKVKYSYVEFQIATLRYTTQHTHHSADAHCYVMCYRLICPAVSLLFVIIRDCATSQGTQIPELC